MASRYGRNQKRKHREEIAAKANTINSLVRKLDQQSRTIRDFVKLDEEFVRLLGPDTAFRVETREVITDRLNPYHCVQQRDPASVFDYMVGGEMAFEETVSYVRLRQVYAAVSRDHQKYGSTIRIRMTDGKDRALYIPDETLLRESDIMYLLERAAEDFVRIQLTPSPIRSNLVLGED